MDTKAKKSKLYLVIVSIFIIIIIFTIILILLIQNGKTATTRHEAEIERLTSDTEIQEPAAPSQEDTNIQKPVAQESVTAAAAVRDSRLPEIPSNETITNGWPIDVTFSRKYDDTLCGELDRSNYKAIYIDLEKYLRVAQNGSVEVSYGKGTQWQTYETHNLNKDDFLYWMAVHEAPGMTGYSVSKMLDLIENGANVNYAAFSDGNEIYFVMDDEGVYLIPYMPNKIHSVWIDGQRMTITSTTIPLIISDRMVQSFYNLLVEIGTVTRDKANYDYSDKMRSFRNNDATSAGEPLFKIVE